MLFYRHYFRLQESEILMCLVIVFSVIFAISPLLIKVRHFLRYDFFLVNVDNEAVSCLLGISLFHTRNQFLSLFCLLIDYFSFTLHFFPLSQSLLPNP